MTQRDYPRIVVPPPGPNAKAIIDRDESWTSTSYIKEYPLVISWRASRSHRPVTITPS
jgi:hypothetical protein